MTDEHRKRIRIGDRVSICPRGKKGIYTAEFWDGRQHRRRSLKTTNQKVAKTLAMEIEVQLARGDYEEPIKPKEITTAIIEYIDYLQTEGRRGKTTVRYRGILTAFSKYAAKNNVVTLKQVSIQLIDGYRSARKLELAPKSMRNEGVLLKSFLEWCRQRKLIRENPMAQMRFPKPPPKKKGGPSLDQIEQILKASPSSKSVKFAMLAFTGMRSGELQRLKPCDVDLDNNWIHIVSRDGAETKTGHSRKVPIHSRLRDVLDPMPRNKRQWYFTAPPSKKYPLGDHYVNTKHLNEDLLKILEELGTPAGREHGFTVHSFRHSFETICVNANIPQRIIDTWLGHRSDSSMANVYYRLSDEESQRMMTLVPFTLQNASSIDAESE